MRGSSTTRTTICWLATPSRTFLGRPASEAKLLSSLAERLRVGHLAVADEALGQVEAGGAHHATAHDLGRGEVAAIDVEADRTAI